ncbi:hypothetical protein [Jatrophihabitans endophyticus]|uniref:hypothetical protein n=1 Tax=Jatrophihabitans endophyticus TaxID=1206085 RepID=UPI0019E2E3A9|nr:hypothetical protein [Jatrophihabitans endophyticus]MBE7189554.1 hypothetical protein [Jatrophihabitans endophyticus]
MLEASWLRARLASRIDEAFPGLAPARDGRWTAPLSAEHRAVLLVEAMKGASYQIVFGISCSWIPTLRNRRITWHRTAKNARQQLWVDAHSDPETPFEEVSLLRSEAIAVAQIDAMIVELQQRAPAWWSSVSTLRGVLTEAERQASFEYNIHNPRPWTVAAFTCARMGDVPGYRRWRDAGPLSEGDDSLAEQALTVLLDRGSDELGAAGS